MFRFRKASTWQEQILRKAIAYLPVLDLVKGQAASMGVESLCQSDGKKCLESISLVPNREPVRRIVTSLSVLVWVQCRDKELRIVLTRGLFTDPDSCHFPRLNDC